MEKIKQNLLLKNILFVISSAAYVALTVPATTLGIGVGLAVISIFYIITRFTPNILDFLKSHFYKSYLIVSIMLSGILGLRFEKVWRASTQVKEVSERLGINSSILLYSVGIIAAIIAVFFCFTILTFCLEYPNKLLDKKNSSNRIGKRMQKNIIYNKYFIIGTIIVLVMQTILLIYWGTQKQGYHVDEVYTFELSNYSDTVYGDTENSYAYWNDGSIYSDIADPNGTELFNYTIPYWNSETDNHPLIYYSIIHTISSIFKVLNIGINKWIGLIPNIAFCLATTFTLILLFYKLTQKLSFSFLGAAFWAFSIGAINTAVYIRMYALLTFCCVLLAYVHYIFYESIDNQRITKKLIFALQGCTITGILSQYYFLIFAFFLCGITFIALVVKRKWNILRCYVATEISAIVISILLFPRMIVRLFFGDRGTEALSNAIGSDGYIESLKSVYKIISNELFNGKASIVFAIILTIVIVYFIYRGAYVVSRKSTLFTKGYNEITRFSTTLPEAFIGQLCIVTVLFICTITKITPYLVDRYYMCIFPILTTCVIYIIFSALLFIFSKLHKGEFISSIIALLIVCIPTIISYSTQEVDYIYANYAERRDLLSPYKDLPVIVLNNDHYDDSSLKWIFELAEYDDVFLCRNNRFEDLKIAASSKDLDEGFLLYAHMYTEDDKDIISEARKNMNINNYKVLTDIGDCRVYYCTT